MVVVVCLFVVCFLLRAVRQVEMPSSCSGMCGWVKNWDRRGPDISLAIALGMSLFSGLQFDRKRWGKSGVLTKLQEKK